MKFNVEYTDTYGGEANYSWVGRTTVHMPEMTHYGYDGSNYGKIRKTFDRELMRKAKAAVGLTGVKGTTHNQGDTIEFRPYRCCTVLFVTFADND